MTQPTFGTVAPTSRRAVAYIIDAAIAAGIGVVLSILLVVFAVLAGPDGMLGVVGVGAPLIWLVLLGWFVFYTVMQVGGGSIGMRAQGLRLVREDGAPLGFWKGLLRNIIFGLAASIVVGYFSPLFDGSGRFQGWHDKVARSLMLDARTGARASTAPPTVGLHVPPRPETPNGAPPIPGLATPSGASSFAAPTAPTPASPGLRANPALPTAPAMPASYAPPTAPAAPTAPSTPAPSVFDETVRAPEPARPQAPSIAHPSAPVAGESSLIAFVPGITQDGPPERSAPAQDVPPVPEAPATPAVATPAETAGPAPATDDAGDIEDTRISIPGHRLVFTWDDGTRVTVSRRTLFGRNPAPEDGATVVSVRDETLSLSKTHFEAAAETSGGWIMDRHSTNGTAIVRDGHRIVCEPGEQVRIRLGDAIEIGDRIVTVGGYA
ncbi:RDD family protein [Microbacterium sp. NPDC077644]|uniref:RDD family protein n=1 Tax=Microbacterium sp. NPDC077644 TaxID=3155055 RepID=UPI0034504F10